MKLPLVGSSYSNRSLAGAAQTCVNLFSETIEDPYGSGKSLKILVGTPGVHLLADLSAHVGNVRGIWTGGGRVFVVVGRYLYEIYYNGAIAPSYPHLMPTANNGLPVQMFANGNQLGIVADGYFLVDDGAGVSYQYFQTAGTVSAAGTAITWTSGDQWAPTAPVGRYITIGGNNYLVTGSSDATHLVIATSLGGGTGTVTRNGSIVFWSGGNTFDSTWVGLTITINAVAYTVNVVSSQYVLSIVETPAGVEYGSTYTVTLTNLPYTAAFGDLVTALTGCYLDGQAYVQRPQGGTPDLGRTVNFSAVFDFTSWSGLDFFQKEGGPDYIQSILSDREQIFVFGTQTDSEVWQNDPNTGRPARLQGAVAQEGSAARYVPVSMQERIYFLGQSPGGGPCAYRVDGFTPTRVSTHAVEQQWATSGSLISDAVGWWYLDAGHYFWVIWFPTGSAWVYDATEKSWSERLSWTGSAFAAYRSKFHAFVPEFGYIGQHLVGDYNSAKVLIMDNSYADDDGADIKRQRQLPYLFNGGKRVFVGRVQLTQLAGPTVNLEWSSDDGASWSTPEAGSDATTTPYWFAQGSWDHSVIPRLSTLGQTAVTLIDLDVEVGDGTA